MDAGPAYAARPYHRGGSAIMGKKVGDKATYLLPNGRASTVEILEAVPYVGA